MLRTIFFLCILSLWWTDASAGEQDTYMRMNTATYFDKTAGCIAGHLAGVLSGFEFAGGRENPRICLPDEWFALCHGPYGGGLKRGCAGTSLIGNRGRIASDDDYHIDFFNQLIFAEYGPDPAYADIAAMWKKHQVRDWGGGAHAMRIINRHNYFPPFTGRLEYGNRFGWCTEAYIENETIGCVFPGMPASAAVLGDRFASVTGDFESQLAGKFLAVLYSVAYFETDAVQALRKALAVMPEGAWIRRMCDKAFALHAKYPNNWRKAARELYTDRRAIFLMDNPQTAYDVNIGFTVLAILYGKNDFFESVRIASLIGYDADCTAATVGGLLGILKGIEALPATVQEAVWKNGTGIYLNDNHQVPYIRQNYPEEQTLGSIVLQYRENAEKAIVHCGGKIEGSTYVIRVQKVPADRSVAIINADFEAGNLNLHFWHQGSAWAGAENAVPAHNGTGCLRVNVIQPGSQAKAQLKVRGLKPGVTYRLSGYLMADKKCHAHLFVEGENTPYSCTATWGNDSLWFHRTLLFTALDTVLYVGLHGLGPGQGNCYLDDVSLETYDYEQLVILNAAELAEQTSLKFISDQKTRNYIRITSRTHLRLKEFQIASTKEYLLRIGYVNTSPTMVNATLSTDHTIGNIGFPVTGEKPLSTQNILEIPIRLKKGKNTILLNDFSARLDIMTVELIAPDIFETVN